MRRFIHKLQKKPKSTRQKIALGTSASVTGLIFIVWLTVLFQGGGLTPTDTAPETQTASPISALQNNAAAAVSLLQEQLESQPSTSSTAAVNAANDISTSSTATATRDISDSKDNNRSQRVEREPYWQANDKNEEGNRSQPDTKSGPGFWQDDPDDKNDGWF